MKAFHNDPKIKEKYLARVIEHRKADDIEKGIYWENGKGCAVGCTIHGHEHKKYEIELGIPRLLAFLEDNIFENLPNDRAKLWPEQFLSAIEPVADLSKVWEKFSFWLMTDEKYGVINFAKTDEEKNIIKKVADNLKLFDKIKKTEWIALYISASNIFNTANTAAYAYADAAAAYAAAAYAVAAYAANTADSASDAASNINTLRHNVRIAQADKFLELLREAS